MAILFSIPAGESRDREAWQATVYVVAESDTTEGLLYLDGLAGKLSAWNAGDTGDASLVPGSGRSSEGGNSNPLQYACQKIPLDRGEWQVTVQTVAKKSEMT